LEVILTGSTGYLGSRVARSLLELGFTVIAPVRKNSKRIEYLKSVCIPHNSLVFWELNGTNLNSIWEAWPNTEIVIHAATNYGRLGEPADNVRDTNVKYPLELLTGGLNRKLKFFVNLDSFFGKQVQYLDSWAHFEYARSKQEFLTHLHTFDDRLSILNLRIEHMYGPNDDPQKFIPWAIKSIAKQQVVNLPLTRGESTRDFIFVDDVVSAVITAVKQLTSVGQSSRKIHPKLAAFDLGTGVSTPVKSVPLLIKKLSGSPTHLDFGGIQDRNEEIPHSVSDMRFQSFFGWKAKVTLEAGIKEALRLH
jgi:CDP-paratose synthetase